MTSYEEVCLECHPDPRRMRRGGPKLWLMTRNLRNTGNPGNCRNPGMSSRLMIPLRTSIAKSTFGRSWRFTVNDFSERDHRRPPGRPKGASEMPMAPQGVSKRTKCSDKERQKEADGVPMHRKGGPWLENR
jgi:hypothetical protein